MANHRQAAKRARQNPRRAARNSARQSRVNSAVRTLRSVLGQSEQEKVLPALLAATRELRKAASKGLIHKKQASRRVSRLVQAANSRLA